jgi:hypothetical protein
MEEKESHINYLIKYCGIDQHILWYQKKRIVHYDDNDFKYNEYCYHDTLLKSLPVLPVCLPQNIVKKLLW